ncbi:LLM class flavin-dependent oxidoreductase [Bosea sp. (in: a-proteobacteria)]|jgi:FMN-dependent oxidoreductase (nitrilotriacetate monooxygenase family)|uniref:LLM class flavin-dependent oxidoreductase n=1 Tax=Bosea sp. (in: a-proteobacteria) TaxID=1871050 RepID=UPI002DDD9CB5|nr:LLM class flavin-dependent oxidoreductase [Bosea sp. (in: a-proteobacteria)]HEV2508442.1 LLM class flavin-dependent oxidoreductase [Bosea sp. (in: a-proteobacteria)]
MTVSPRTDKIKLGAFIHPTGNHVAAWLHPDAQIDAGTNFEHYVEVAQTAERGLFDLMFIADAITVRDGDVNALKRWPQYMAFFDPMILFSGIAARTKHIGLVATSTTSYNEPYNIARRYASLDHVSGGRAGWNVVTSANASEAWNFGREEHYELNERYDRAVEFVQVVKGLWDSWEDDAFLRDRESALYFDPAKLHTLNHKGRHFSVKGPLNVARPPQGHPVLAHAAASDVGKDVAARTAEVMFSHVPELEQAMAFYADMKARVAKAGRAPDSIKIMPGLNAIVGRTRREAQEKHQFLQDSIHPDVGRELLSNALGGMDLSPYPDDQPFPDDVAERMMSHKNPRYFHMFRDRLTPREMYQHYAGARGQRTVIGTAEDIADQMELWFQSRAVDGFLVQPAVLPTGLEEFVDLVVPVLQERGLFRTEYEGRTLRENLGVERPVNRYAHEAMEKTAGAPV